MRWNALMAVSALALLGACTTSGKTERGAVTGAAIGGLAGAVIGNNVGSGNAGQGAAIGAVVGGAGGAYVGCRQDGGCGAANKREYYDNRSGRYYYYDKSRDRYFYENGQAYP